MVDAKLFIDVIFKGLNKQMTDVKRQVSGVVGKGPKFETSSIIAANKELLNIGKTYNRLNDAGLLTNETVMSLKDNFKSAFNVVNPGMKNLDREFKNVVKSQKAFNFNFLTFLFAGMMLQRTFGGALRSIIDSYKKMAGMNSEFNRGVLKLNASWNFLKFSIANALNSPAVINGMQWLTDGLETMADYFSENEWAAQALLATLTGLFALGTGSVLIGSFMQFGLMFEKLLPLIQSFGGVITSLGGLATASLVATSAAVYLAWSNDFANMQDHVDDLFDSMGKSSSAAFETLKDGLSDVSDAMTAFFEGDYEKFSQSMKNIAQGVSKLTRVLLLGLIDLGNKAMLAIWDLVVTSFSNMSVFLAKWAIDTYNDIIDWLGIGDGLKVKSPDNTEFKKIVDETAEYARKYLGVDMLKEQSELSGLKLQEAIDWDIYADDVVKASQRINEATESISVAGLFGSQQLVGPMSLVNQNSGLQSSIRSTNDMVVSSTTLMNQDTEAKIKNADATERLARANELLFNSKYNKATKASSDFIDYAQSFNTTTVQ